VSLGPTLIPAILYDMLGVEAVERTQETLHTVTCYRPSRRDEWRDTAWLKTRVADQTRKRPHFIESSHDLHCPTPAWSYTRLGLVSCLWVRCRRMRKSEVIHLIS